MAFRLPIGILDLSIGLSIAYCNNQAGDRPRPYGAARTQEVIITHGHWQATSPGRASQALNSSCYYSGWG